MKRPLIGITIDNVDSSVASGRYESNIAYSRVVAEAGGIPLLLPQELSLAEAYVNLCDGIMLTGGDDAIPEIYGAAVHPEARCIAPQRQAFELALLDALQKKNRPTLGVCLGMQLMALHAGGKMNQHLPDTHPHAVQEHQHDHHHPITFEIEASKLLTKTEPNANLSQQDFSGHTVVSSHHQAVTDAGSLRVVAKSPDGVIEAIDNPAHPYFYVGVQWHPERGEGMFNRELIHRFVATCAQAMV